MTGASGLVGGRLCRFLRDRGFRVVRGVREPDRKNQGDFETRRLCWNDPQSIETLSEGIGAVVHLSSPNASAVRASPDLVDEISKGNRLLFQSFKKNKVNKVVYLSTIHVYGHALRGEIHEETSPKTPSPYGRMHSRTELALQESGLPYAILRSTNGVGWPISKLCNCWSLLANDLSRKAAESGTIALRDAHVAFRDFLALSEILRGLDHFLGLGRHLQGTFLLGSGKTRTTAWLAQTIDRIFKEMNRSVLREGFNSSGDFPPAPFHLNISKAQSVGFTPQEAVEEELKELAVRCVDWFGAHPVGSPTHV